MKATIMYENYCNVAPAKAGVQAQLQPQHLFFEKFITANNNQSQIKYSKTFLYIHGLKPGSRPSDFAKATTDRSPGRPRLRIKLSAVAPDFAQPVRQRKRRRSGYDGQAGGYGRQAPGTAKKNAVGVITSHNMNYYNYRTRVILRSKVFKYIFKVVSKVTLCTFILSFNCLLAFKVNKEIRAEDLHIYNIFNNAKVVLMENIERTLRN